MALFTQGDKDQIKNQQFPMTMHNPPTQPQELNFTIVAENDAINLACYEIMDDWDIWEQNETSHCQKVFTF